MAFKWDVNLGHMLIAVPLAVGGTAYLVTDHNAVQSLTASVQQLRSDMTAQFASVHTEIANFPDVRAQQNETARRVTDLEKNARDRDDKAAAVESRLSVVERLQPQTYRNPPR